MNKNLERRPKMTIEDLSKFDRYVYEENEYSFIRIEGLIKNEKRE